MVKDSTECRALLSLSVAEPAQAAISKDGRTISLTSRMVPEPVAFRYAWARTPMGNIINLAT